MDDNPAEMQIDLNLVVARLEQQLGAAYGQITKLEVAMGQLVKQQAEAGNQPAPGAAS